MDTEKLSKVIDLFHKFAMDTEADSSLLDGDVPTEDTAFEEPLSVDEAPVDEMPVDEPISEPKSAVDFSNLDDEQLAELADAVFTEQGKRSRSRSKSKSKPILEFTNQDNLELF